MELTGRSEVTNFTQETIAKTTNQAYRPGLTELLKFSNRLTGRGYKHKKRRTKATSPNLMRRKVANTSTPLTTWYISCRQCEFFFIAVDVLRVFFRLRERVTPSAAERCRENISLRLDLEHSNVNARENHVRITCWAGLH